MNYGLADKSHALKYAIAVCNCLGHGENHTAVEQVLETAAAEALLGEFRDPTRYGAGTGLTQVDKGTFLWLQKRYGHGKTADKLREAFNIDVKRIRYQELEHSPLLAFVFCRLRYLPVRQAIPADREGRAEYWKKHYNTSAGKGTPEEYLSRCEKAGIDLLLTNE